MLLLAAYALENPTVQASNTSISFRVRRISWLALTVDKWGQALAPFLVRIVWNEVLGVSCNRLLGGGHFSTEMRARRISLALARSRLRH